MPHPSLPLQGYSTPYVKDGRVVLPARVNGDLVDLLLPVTVARQLGKDLLVAGPRRALKVPAAKLAQPGAPLTKPNGRIL